MNNIEILLERIKTKKVLIIGESILDRFVYCKFQGNSIKSFCPVVKIEENIKNEDQKGGAFAIYRHLKDFINDIDLISNPIEEIIKTRYLDVDSGLKYFETNYFDLKKKVSHFNIDYKKYDIIIIADFGHGFCNYFPDDIDNVFLMCQTNSSNYGFNRVSKWKHLKKELVCIDKREASLQINKNYNELQNDYSNIFDIYNYELNTKNLIVTLGAQGGVLFDGLKLYEYTAIRTNIVDTIGSGDAFFAFISILNSIHDIKQDEKLKIASAAAALTTTWLANSKSVNKTDLINFINNYAK
jgi:bifunctional ADP-heptose synthase (sugar kinase/adenylyltransferase)